MAIMCNECGGGNANDFGERFNFFLQKNKGDEIISLRYLCDECAREISILLITWSNHIDDILLQKARQKQGYSCKNCRYKGVYADFEIKQSDDLKCPKCKYVRKVIAIG